MEVGNDIEKELVLKAKLKIVYIPVLSSRQPGLFKYGTCTCQVDQIAQVYQCTTPALLLHCIVDERLFNDLYSGWALFDDARTCLFLVLVPLLFTFHQRVQHKVSKNSMFATTCLPRCPCIT